MIPALIILLTRRYKNNHPQKFELIKNRVFYAAKILAILIAVILIAAMVSAQEKYLTYNIKKGGQKIGEMKIKEIKNGTTLCIKMESLIKTRFFVSVTAKVVEEALYEKGVLQHSFAYQQTNGNEKLNKRLRYVNNNYILHCKGIEHTLDLGPVYYNLVCIYTREPVSQAVIYSDKFQKLIPIQLVEMHHYKITFPDGNYNEYYYENGTCTKIQVNSSFYTAVMELKN